MPSLVLLLPTYNEENNIKLVIDDIKSSFSGIDYQIVIADSNSSDKTQEIAKANGAEVINYFERGKAKAIAFAFKQITADYIIMLDADRTYKATDALEIYKKLLEGNEVVLGSRIKGKFEDGSMNFVNLFGNHFLNFAANAFYGTSVSDVCTGLWGFSKKAYKKFEIDAIHFELEANLFCQSVNHGFRIAEVPITYRKRGGKSKLRVSDGFKIFWYFLKNKAKLFFCNNSHVESKLK